MGDVSTLATKAWDDFVEAGTFVAKSFFSGAQRKKIFCCLWTNITSQQHNMANGFIANSDVKEILGIGHGAGYQNGMRAA